MKAVPYEAQHGTPFRLLSFAPSYEPSSIDPLVGQKTTFAGSQSYPDWALLDLLYIPSTLAPFGSKYNPATANPSAQQRGNEPPLLWDVRRGDRREDKSERSGHLHDKRGGRANQCFAHAAAGGCVERGEGKPDARPGRPTRPSLTVRPCRGDHRRSDRKLRPHQRSAAHARGNLQCS